MAGDHAARFRQAIDLDQRHAEGAKEAHHVGRYGRRAGQGHARLAQPAEVLQRAEHQQVVPGKARALGQAPVGAALGGERGAGGQCPVVQRAAQAAGLLALDRQRGVHLFPDARHAQEDAGRNLAQVFLHGADRLAKVHLRTQVGGHEAGQHLLGDVAQRQVGQVAGARVHAQALDDAGHHAADVAPRQHGALGFAGGTRGVDHQADVVQALRRQRRVDGGLRAGLLAQALDLGEGGDQFALGGREAAQALGLHDDDLFERRQAGTRFEQLVGLLLVLADHHRDVGVADDVGHLAARTGWVDADGDGADQPGAHLRQHPFNAVLRQHADMAARRNAQGRQSEGEGTGAAVVVGPGEGFPDAEVLLPDGDARGIALRALAQHLRQGDFEEGHDSHRLRRL